MSKPGLVFIIPTDHPLVDKQAEIGDFLDMVKREFDEVSIAALRLASAGLEREAIEPRAKAILELGAKRDVSVLLDEHARLSKELGFSGVHLHQPDPKALREARKILDKDAIIGVHAGASKHEGMVLAEIGVDYVAFGPLEDLGFDQELAPAELFTWWSEMITVPLIAEGGLSAENLTPLKDAVDFIALGPEVFGAKDPRQALAQRLSIW